MKLPLRYKILLYVIVPLVILCYLPTLSLPYLSRLIDNCDLLGSELSHYALENSGVLPNNKDVALKETEISEKVLKQFGFSYGIDINKVVKKDGRLYDKSGKRLFLIYPKGLKFWLNDRCEKFSLQLYENYKKEKHLN